MEKEESSVMVEEEEQRIEERGTSVMMKGDTRVLRTGG